MLHFSYLRAEREVDVFHPGVGLPVGVVVTFALAPPPAQVAMGNARIHRVIGPHREQVRLLTLHRLAQDVTVTGHAVV